VGSSRQQSPYTSAGLTGTGQVVGISDTGLDEKSCFFNDLSGQVQRSLPGNPITDLARRKVVQYTHLNAADTFDVTNGHGTHVAGTVIGNNREDVFSGALMLCSRTSYLFYVCNSISLFMLGGKLSGVAPDARVAFMDIATASGVLYGPSVQETYPSMRKAGAMVCTNSWGGTFSGGG
jgi:serine protease AprX